MEGIRLVISDWSGVISDDRQLVYETNVRMFQKRGWQPMEYDALLKGAYANVVEAFQNYGAKETAREIEREYSLTLEAVRAEGIHPTPYADALSFVANMIGMGKRVAVVSAHPIEHLEEEVEEFGLRSLLAALVGSAKDKAESIALLLEQERESRERAMYVGDMVSDMIAAKRVGVRAVGVATGYHARERLEAERPELVVNSLTELSRLIKERRSEATVRDAD